MELTLASFSSLAFGTVHGHRNLGVAPGRMRSIKPRKSAALPHLTIASQINDLQLEERRSANYHPSVWDPEYIQSLSTPYTFELYCNKLEALKAEAGKLIQGIRDSSSLWELIDSMQRLGVAYHFEEEIKDAINRLVRLDDTDASDLFTTSLRFRLSRQHGHPVSSGVFDKFISKDGEFKDGIIQDVAGLLSLYEATYLGVEGENALDELRKFSYMHLKSLVGDLEGDLADQVHQSLELPLHWRMPRLEARNFVDVYQRRDTKNLALLELAQLDYNLVQSVYQKELKDLTRCNCNNWNPSCLMETTGERQHGWINRPLNCHKLTKVREFRFKISSVEIENMTFNPEEVSLVSLISLTSFSLQVI